MMLLVCVATSERTILHSHHDCALFVAFFSKQNSVSDGWVEGTAMPDKAEFS